MTWAIVNISDNLTTDPTRCDHTYNLHNITVMPRIYVDVYIQVAYPLPFQLSLFHSIGTDIIHANSNAMHRPLLSFLLLLLLILSIVFGYGKQKKRNNVRNLQKKEEIFA